MSRPLLIVSSRWPHLCLRRVSRDRCSWLWRTRAVALPSAAGRRAAPRCSCERASGRRCAGHNLDRDAGICDLRAGARPKRRSRSGAAGGHRPLADRLRLIAARERPHAASSARGSRGNVNPPAGVPSAIDTVADRRAGRRVSAETDRGSQRHRRVHSQELACIVAHERGHLTRDNLKRWLMASLPQPALDAVHREIVDAWHNAAEDAR